MPHLDEGTIHAWLDGALPPDEGARVEAHAAECATCAAAVAEARGLIAASSRILTALDDVPGEVMPLGDRAAAAIAARRRPRFWGTRYARIAAAAALVAVGIVVVRESEQKRSGDAMSSAESLLLDTASSAASRVAPATPSAPPTPQRGEATATSAVESSDAAVPVEQRAAVGAGVASPSIARAQPLEALEAEATRDVARDELTPAKSGRVAGNVAPTDSARAREEQFAAEPPPAAPATGIVNPRSMRKIRGAEQLAGPALAQISGRVTDSTGVPIASAQVTVVGTNRGDLTEADGSFRIAGVPEGMQTVEARQLGYASARETVNAAAGDSVTIDLALVRSAVRLGEDVVTGAVTAADAEDGRTIPGLALLNTSESVVDGRPVRRSLYQLRPGVTITLVERRARAEQAGAPAAVSPQGMPARRATATPRQRTSDTLRGTNEAAEQINTIWWTSSDGTEFTLSGAVPVTELQELRRRIEGARE